MRNAEEKCGSKHKILLGNVFFALLFSPLFSLFFYAPSVHLLSHIAIVPVAVDLFVFTIPFAAVRAAETMCCCRE